MPWSQVETTRGNRESPASRSENTPLERNVTHELGAGHSRGTAAIVNGVRF